MKIFVAFIIILGISSCGALTKVDKGADVYANYSEDLSATRISYPSIKEIEAKQLEVNATSAVEPINTDLNTALNNMTTKNIEEKYYSGFTILVYSGVDRDLAFQTRNNLYALHPDAKIDMQFQQPRYLIKVGKYVNRIEAQSNFHKLKENFPSSQIIQDRFLKDNSFNSDNRGNVDR